MKINRLFVSETFFRLIKRYCFGIRTIKHFDVMMAVFVVHLTA